MAAARIHKVFRWSAAALAALGLACGAAQAQRAAVTNNTVMIRLPTGPMMLMPIPNLPRTPGSHAVTGTVVNVPPGAIVVAVGNLTTTGGVTFTTTPPAPPVPPAPANPPPIVDPGPGGVVITMANFQPPSFAIIAGSTAPTAALTAKGALDHVINTSQIVEAQSAAIVGGSVVLSGGQ
jgi:hypothetical protein